MSSETGGRGQLWILSAPSGTGKTTLIHRLLAAYPQIATRLAFSVSHTTRQPRPGEVDGRDYWFIDRKTFAERVAADRFLEWAEVHGELYGTARDQVEHHLAQGIDVLLDVDVQGAAQVRDRTPQARSIFILPPSYQALAERLRWRAQDDPAQISRRLQTARVEVQRCASYDYVILNAQLDEAAAALAAVILAGRHQRERVWEQLQEVLASFADAP